MKPILTFILLLTCCGPAWTQDDPAPTVPPSETGPLEAETTSNTPALIETHIYSDTVELGIKSRTAVYRGNVRLVDPRIRITCEQLTANVPEKGGRVEQVIAQTNVAILVLDEEGRTNRAFADQAVYTFKITSSGTNEMVELTGDSDPLLPRIERPEGVLIGSPIVWNRIKNTAVAKNQRTISRALWDKMVAAALLESATNSPAPPTNPTNATIEQMKTEALEATSNPQTTPPVTGDSSDE